MTERIREISIKIFLKVFGFLFVICYVGVALTSSRTYQRSLYNAENKDEIDSTVTFYRQVYPTALRSTAVGACSGVARLGAMLTPYVAQVRQF